MVLRTLHIRNLALVVDLEMEFGPGLNVITGETGAGKSLLLGAVQLLLGMRADAALIRRGEPRCEVSARLSLEGVPEASRRRLDGLLSAAGVEAREPDGILLRRLVSATGGRCYVNGSAVPAQLLRDLGAHLVDIHGPNDQQNLLQPGCQLELLDAFAGCAAARDRCAELFGRCRVLDRGIAALEGDALVDGEAELLAFQVQEIVSAALEAEEEPRLLARVRIGEDAQRLIRLAEQCRRALDDSEECVVDRLSQALRLLRELAETDEERGRAFVDQMEQAVTSLQELASDLGDYGDSFELDEEGLRRAEARLDVIQRLKRKYGPTVRDVLETLAGLRQREEVQRTRAARLEQLRAEREDLGRRQREACGVLSTLRREAAAELGERIVGVLGRIGFPRGLFEVRLESVEPGASGSDRVVFCFGPNPGEPVLPLPRIASSGEISRVTLAVKTVLCAADPVPVLIFDEVDANIGGRVAVAVAEELRAVGRRHQVLSVTHLPQIAAAAATHFQVSKVVEEGRTVTRVARLEDGAREAEILRMMGASESSEAALEHAREMLSEAAGMAPAVAPSGH